MTPTLALAVEREAAIRSFVPESFYTVTLNCDGVVLSGERIYLGAYEALFLSHAPLFTLYAQAFERRISVCHISSALRHFTWNVSHTGYFLHLHRNPRKKLPAS